MRLSPPPPRAARGPRPPFIDQGEAVSRSCRAGLSISCSGMAHNVVELMFVLANLAPGGRRGESCARPGGFEGSGAGTLVWPPSVCQFKGPADGRPEAAQRPAWRCPVDLSSHSAGDDAAVLGMVA
jgi:hypothetical protein